MGCIGIRAREEAETISRSKTVIPSIPIFLFLDEGYHSTVFVPSVLEKTPLRSVSGMMRNMSNLVSNVPWFVYFCVRYPGNPPP